MGGLEILFLSFIIGLVTNYFIDLKYLKYLRGESETKYSDIAIILCSIIWGTPVVLFMYALFPEIRLEDSTHKRRLLISEVVILVIQIVVVVLLGVFGLLTISSGDNSETEALSSILQL